MPSSVVLEHLNSAQKTARIAGAPYLLSAAAAGVPLIYIPSALIVDGNAAATAHNILASEMIFRALQVASEEWGVGKSKPRFMGTARPSSECSHTVSWHSCSLARLSGVRAAS